MLVSSIAPDMLCSSTLCRDVHLTPWWAWIKKLKIYSFIDQWQLIIFISTPIQHGVIDSITQFRYVAGIFIKAKSSYWYLTVLFFLSPGLHRSHRPKAKEERSLYGPIFLTSDRHMADSNFTLGSKGFVDWSIWSAREGYPGPHRAVYVTYTRSRQNFIALLPTAPLQYVSKIRLTQATIVLSHHQQN